MSLRDLVLVYIICVIWGFNFIAAATALLGLQPFWFTVLRLALVLVPLLWFVRLPPREDLLRMTAVALLNGGLHFLLVFMALATAEDISSVAILLQTYVPFSAILAVFLLGEKIGWRSALAIATAFAGVLLVSLDPMVFANLESVGLCLLSALSLALGTNLMRGLKKTNPFTFQAFTALVSIPVLLPFAFYYEGGIATAVADAQWIHWSAVAYSGLISSVIGHGLLFYLVQRNPVSEVTPHLLLAPILAIIFGIFIWGDLPGWRLWTGGAMVLGGVLGVAVRARKRHEVIVERVEGAKDI